MESVVKSIIDVLLVGVLLGALFVFAWVLLWTVIFPGGWEGYSTVMKWVFVIGAVVGITGRLRTFLQ